MILSCLTLRDNQQCAQLWKWDFGLSSSRVFCFHGLLGFVAVKHAYVTCSCWMGWVMYFFFIFGHARDMYIHVKNLIVFEAALRVPGCLGCEVTENLVRTLWRRHLMVARLTWSRPLTKYLHYWVKDPMLCPTLVSKARIFFFLCVLKSYFSVFASWVKLKES